MSGVTGITKFSIFFEQMASSSSDKDAILDEDWFGDYDSSDVDEFAEKIELIESNPVEIEAQLLDSITEASQI